MPLYDSIILIFIGHGFQSLKPVPDFSGIFIDRAFAHDLRLDNIKPAIGCNVKVFLIDIFYPCNLRKRSS
jgi:hypothetical protein